MCGSPSHLRRARVCVESCVLCVRNLRIFGNVDATPQTSDRVRLIFIDDFFLTLFSFLIIFVPDVQVGDLFIQQ